LGRRNLKEYVLVFRSETLALTPAFAHLLELPNKIKLSREDYRTVQQNYRGWSRTGFFVAGALLSLADH